MGLIIELCVRPVRSDQVLVRADIIFSNYLDRFSVELFDHLNSPRGVQHPKKRHDLIFGITSGWEIDFYTSEVFPVSGY